MVVLIARNVGGEEAYILLKEKKKMKGIKQKLYWWKARRKLGRPLTTGERQHERASRRKA